MFFSLNSRFKQIDKHAQCKSGQSTSADEEFECNGSRTVQMVKESRPAGFINAFDRDSSKRIQYKTNQDQENGCAP